MTTLEVRWNGPQQVKNLGDDPSKSQINALFAIPGDTKSDSSLPHHKVSPDGTVGAADLDGCMSALGVLNGAMGGVNASTAEKNRAWSHLASHVRSGGGSPPDKKFAAGQPLELRRQRRASMLHVPERLNVQFGAAGVEMRARPNGTGGTKFQFCGYAAVYLHPFEMWDFWGDQFTEKVGLGAGARTLANNCDVPFLVGHWDCGIPMARTKSGTMNLGEDSHGLWVDAPSLDGSLEQIRQLASAVERGDMDEMSMAFVTIRQDWSPDYEERTILEYDLHKGDVSVVVFGANDGTAGSSMVALPAEQLLSRRPTGIRQRGEQRSPHDPMSGTHSHSHPAYGSQGTDANHEHEHSHDGDANHDHPHVDADGDYDGDRARRRPGERRDGGGDPNDNTPDYDPQPHSSPDAIQCPSDACPVQGGAMNSPDAKYCDQCGGSLYSADGTIIVGNDGVPTDVQGDPAMALALRQRQLELLKLAG